MTNGSKLSFLIYLDQSNRDIEIFTYRHTELRTIDSYKCYIYFMGIVNVNVNVNQEENLLLVSVHFLKTANLTVVGLTSPYHVSDGSYMSKVCLGSAWVVRGRIVSSLISDLMVTLEVCSVLYRIDNLFRYRKHCGMNFVGRMCQCHVCSWCDSDRSRLVNLLPSTCGWWDSGCSSKTPGLLLLPWITGRAWTDTHHWTAEQLLEVKSHFFMVPPQCFLCANNTNYRSVHSSERNAFPHPDWRSKDSGYCSSVPNVKSSETSDETVKVKEKRDFIHLGASVFICNDISCISSTSQFWPTSIVHLSSKCGSSREKWCNEWNERYLFSTEYRNSVVSSTRTSTIWTSSWIVLLGDTNKTESSWTEFSMMTCLQRSHAHNTEHVCCGGALPIGSAACGGVARASGARVFQGCLRESGLGTDPSFQ